MMPPSNGTGSAGAYIGNIDNNPYRELTNDDYDDNTADNTDIEIVAAPATIPETIIDVDKESTGVADGETTGGTDEHTGVAMSDNK